MKNLRIISYFLMGLGLLLFVTGLIFRIQHWPDIFIGMLTGGIITFIGALVFIISIIRKK